MLTRFFFVPVLSSVSFDLRFLRSKALSLVKYFVETPPAESIFIPIGEASASGQQA